MTLQQIVFDGLAKDMERNVKKVMKKTVAQAQADGYQVTFAGVYKQATKVRGSAEMPVPFVVAQTPEQRARMMDGTLEGRVYDSGRYASVEGKVSPEIVTFEKRYETASIPEGVEKPLRALRDVMAPHHKGRPLLNPSVIKYEGKSEDEGQRYAGSWSFRNKHADMATTGSFTLERKV